MLEAIEGLSGALAGAGRVQDLLDDLHRRKVLLERVCDAFPGWLVVLDVEGRFRAMSADFAVALGVTREEALGRRCQDLAPQRAAPCMEALAAFRQGDAGPVRTIEQHARGEWSADRVPLRDERGEVVGLVYIARPALLADAALPQRTRYFAHLRRRLADSGYQGSTVLAAESLLLHLLPLFAAAPVWRGPVRRITELCGRSGTSVRRSIRVLTEAGVLSVRRLGPRGLELQLQLPPASPT